jgi:hypothetical protein
MEKKPRKPKTPSIKEHLTDQGFPDAHKLKSIPFDPNGINSFTDKDGTTYKWKVGENPTEKDIVPCTDLNEAIDIIPNFVPYGKEELKVREDLSLAHRPFSDLFNYKNWASGVLKPKVSLPNKELYPELYDLVMNIVDLKPLPESEIERLSPLEILEQYRKESQESIVSLRHLSYEQQLNLPDTHTGKRGESI